MMNDFILCEAYKTARKEETYLFIDKLKGLDSLPEALLAQFPNPELVTSFKLTEDKKMARADAAKVMQEIREQGFYLQLPPPKNAHLDPQLAEIADKNEKLKS